MRDKQRQTPQDVGGEAIFLYANFNDLFYVFFSFFFFFLLLLFLILYLLLCS